MGSVSSLSHFLILSRAREGFSLSPPGASRTFPATCAAVLADGVERGRQKGDGKGVRG